MNNKIYIHIIEFILIIGAKNRCIEVIVLVENVFINVGELVIWKSLILFKTRQIPKQETTAVPQSSIHFHHLIITRSERTMYLQEAANKRAISVPKTSNEDEKNGDSKYHFYY